MSLTYYPPMDNTVEVELSHVVRFVRRHYPELYRYYMAGLLTKREIVNTLLGRII